MQNKLLRNVGTRYRIKVDAHHNFGESVAGAFELTMIRKVQIMPRKQSSPKVSTLASKVLSGKKPTVREAKTLAASVLSQDETKGQSKKK